MALTIIERRGLAEKVLQLSLNKSTREIAEILQKEDGVSVTFKTVANFLKGIREERAQATRALVQKSIQASVPRDLEILDELIIKEYEWFCDNNMGLNDRLEVSRELRQVIATKLKYSGAEEAIAVNLTLENMLGGEDEPYEY